MNALVLNIILVILTLGQEVQSDRPDLAITQIKKELLNNADIVVRHSETHHHIKQLNNRVTKEIRVYTILNEDAKHYGDVIIPYDVGSSEVKNIQIQYFDENGKRIKKVKSKELDDRSYNSGSSLASSSRLKYFDYTPTKYPFTIEYKYEIKSINTLDINPWNPVGYNTSVEHSEYKISSDIEFAVRCKGKNIEGLNVILDTTNYHFSLKDFKAVPKELFQPHYETILPYIMISPLQFSYEGISGSASNWSEFGKWNYNLIKPKSAITEEMVRDLNQIIKPDDSDLKKARIIYDYVSKNMRYVSIQLGIGGIQPFPASEVHNLKYGDCKGLSNYTRSLLDHFNITAYYTVIESNSRYNLSFDSSMPDLFQGNHVIVCMPNDGDTVWVECTSKLYPFGFIGKGNNDRKVLLIKEDGGSIARTKIYPDEANSITHKISAKIEADMTVHADVHSEYENLAIFKRLWYIELSDSERKEALAKNVLKKFNTYDLESYSIKSSRDEALINEDFKINLPGYVEKISEYLMIPNDLITLDFSSNLTSSRRSDIYIKDGFKASTEINWTTPKGYTLVEDNNQIAFSNDFGNISYVTSMKNDTTINLQLSVLEKSGIFDKSLVKEFNQFQNKKKAILKNGITLKKKRT